MKGALLAEFQARVDAYWEGVGRETHPGPGSAAVASEA